MAGRPVTNPDTPNGPEREPQPDGNQAHSDDTDDDEDDDEGEDEINFARAFAASMQKEITPADECQPSLPFRYDADRPQPLCNWSLY